MIVIMTRVNDRCSGESLRMVLTQPWRTLESALDQYIVEKANHLAPSGTSQTTSIIKPVTFHNEEKVMAHAGPSTKSERKHATRLYRIPKAGAMVPISLTCAGL